jgi:hypothetical protein
MKKILGFLIVAAALIIVGCVNDFLNPDIEAVRISPLGYYIVEGVRTVPIDTIAIVARNSQDCHITGFLWEFYDFEDNLIYAAPEPLQISVKLPGLVDTTSADTAYIFGLVVQTDTLSSYMFNNDLMSAKIKYRFIAEADYFSDRTDTADIHIGLYRVSVVYFNNLEAAPESIPRDGGLSAAKITATVQDFSGNIVYGTAVQFSSTGGNLSSTYGLTNSEGKASVYLFSDTGTAPVWYWVTATHPYACSPITIPIKFYIPEP